MIHPYEECSSEPVEYNNTAGSIIGERLPEENVRVIETTENGNHHNMPMFPGTQRRKLYFNPAYFEKQLLAVGWYIPATWKILPLKIWHSAFYLFLETTTCSCGIPSENSRSHIHSQAQDGCQTICANAQRWVFLHSTHNMIQYFETMPNLR